ncbi:N-acyl-D-amino-acid deacylase family protein [Yinghuangia seranimata]|uniref:N-acyl-D-amino-acid deacylase family protein n=1 Tax=Yinghuangia seranimata TaxID=408067 RepID=UPI00248B643E|nr:amidohydrolase family protein [Yinghuangia seranimata]MDI2132809.1 amidohydrolase family protein [Yinghuangia seranimata]
MFDVLLKGGWVLDGTGAPAFRADVAVDHGRVAAVGALPGAQAAHEIDATGRYVAPGFIDAHVHGDALVLDPDVQLAALRQGVTTFVLGQDGLSFAPATPAALAYVTRYFAAVNGTHPGLGEGPVGVADLLATYSGTTRLNTAYLVPHGTVRHSVLGATARPADEADLRAMADLVERSLDEGACGVSTGLEYVPGRYADTAELAALTRVAARRGLPHVSHMRGYEAAASGAMTELLAVARASGVPTHVSHYHGPADELIALVDDARRDGVDLTFDAYPYLRGCSILAMVALPRDLDDPDPDRTLDTLADPRVRARIAAETDPALWPRITLAHVPAEDFAWAEGMRLVEAARAVGASPAAFCAELLIATGLQAGAVFDQPPTNSDASVRALLRHPAHIGGSDGIYIGGSPHPRGWGAFARLLARHVVELGDWTWEQAAVHLAAHPARRFGLTDRGLVRPGTAADLAVIDPAKIADRADYGAARRPADGVDDVLVAGVPVLAAGRLTGHTPGRPLRPR